MIRKDKALLESLTRKYGKGYILNEISNNTIKSAASKAIEKGKYKQAKYFVDNIVDNYENINLSFSEPLYKYNRVNLGFVYNKNKFIGLYEKDSKSSSYFGLALADDYVDILLDKERAKEEGYHTLKDEKLTKEIKDAFNLSGELWLFNFKSFDTLSTEQKVFWDDETINEYIDFWKKVQDMGVKNDIDTSSFDFGYLIEYKEELEKVENIDYDYFENVLTREIGKRCYDYRYTDMKNPNITIPAFMATLKEFKIDSDYELIKNERKSISSGHRGQWVDNRSNVKFALIINGKKIIITIGGGGGGPLSYSGLYYNGEKLAFAEEWYVGWQLNFNDRVLKNLVDDIKKAKNKKTRARKSKK